jgi:hypothetical protein
MGLGVVVGGYRTSNSQFVCGRELPVPEPMARPAARSEGPDVAILAAVRPLGPVRSWDGLGVVRPGSVGAQLGLRAAWFGGR